MANGITEEHRAATRGRIAYAAVRFKYTHGVFFVDEKIRADIAVGDMVVVEGDRGTNIGMIMEDATADVEREIAEAEALAARMRSDLKISNGDGDDAAAVGEESVDKAEASAATAETSSTANPNDMSTRSAIGQSGSTSITASQQPNNARRGNKKKGSSAASNDPVPRFLRVLHNSSNKDRKKFYQARRREGGAASIVQRIIEDLGLPIHVCDAEFQCDFQKLFVFYRVKYSEASNATLDLRDLQRDLFRQYRCRIWLLNWYTELSLHYPQALLGAAHGRQSIVNGVLEPPLVTAALRVPPPMGSAEAASGGAGGAAAGGADVAGASKRPRGAADAAAMAPSGAVGIPPQAVPTAGGGINMNQALRQAVNSGAHKSIARKGLYKTLPKPMVPFNPVTAPSPGGHTYPNAIVPSPYSTNSHLSHAPAMMGAPPQGHYSPQGMGPPSGMFQQPPMGPYSGPPSSMRAFPSPGAPPQFGMAPAAHGFGGFQQQGQVSMMGSPAGSPGAGGYYTQQPQPPQQQFHPAPYQQYGAMGNQQQQAVHQNTFSRNMMPPTPLGRDGSPVAGGAGGGPPQYYQYK